MARRGLCGSTVIFGDAGRLGQRALPRSRTASESTFSTSTPVSARSSIPQLQLQLGVEGPPGAFVVFEDVAFLPPEPRPNCRPRVRRHSGQKDIASVELMPNLPEPFKPTDWRAKARNFDKLVFDFQARGRYLPLVWLDNSHVNLDRPAFGLPSYVGAARQDGGQEGVTCLGAVLGATLAGIDKARQDHDYVTMCEAWFNAKNGLDLVLNLQRQETGGSFWYEIWPNIEFAMLADRYPDHPRLAEIARHRGRSLAAGLPRSGRSARRT